MFGVPLEGPGNVLVDNDTWIKNSTIPLFTLQKKHNAICYHLVHEAVAAKILQIAYIPSGQNMADMFTKCSVLLSYKISAIRFFTKMEI